MAYVYAKSRALFDHRIWRWFISFLQFPTEITGDEKLQLIFKFFYQPDSLNELLCHHVAARYTLLICYLIRIARLTRGFDMAIDWGIESNL